MSDLISSLLDEIAAGRTVFKPNGSSRVEIEAFQPTAEALLELENSGRIQLTLTHITSRFGQNIYDQIVVDKN